MRIKEKSHKNFDYPINEYIGYDKKSLNSKNNFGKKKFRKIFEKI